MVPYGRDALLISDVLDGDTFDPIFKSLRPNAGSSDYLVAIHPWIDRTLLVFMRRSIYLCTIGLDAAGVTIDAETSSVLLVTDEVGCSARESVCTAGSSVFFLSDSGVYRLDTQLDLRVRGNTLPRSEPVADIFANVTPTLLHASKGKYYGNRYYLAFPTATDTSNRTLLIFNTLNQHWETVDRYFVGVDDLLVSLYNSAPRLHMVNNLGKLYLMEEIETGDDPVAGDAMDAVQGRMVTRRFQFQDMHLKRIIKARVVATNPAGARWSAGVNLIDPDTNNLAIGSVLNDGAETEDYSARFPVRRKAHFAEVEILTTAGRPEIRQIELEAAVQTNTLGTQGRQ